MAGKKEVNFLNYWVSHESVEDINTEIEFVSGKARIPEDRVIELMKIQMLNEILILMQQEK